MKGVRFWGTRGSLPVALTAAGLNVKLRGVLRAARGQALDTDADIERLLGRLPFALAGTYGGHSSCVQVLTDQTHGGPDYVVCDMGSGLRPFGQAAMAQRAGKAQTFHVFMSHLHWDHIMGLPFFVPGFVPGNKIVIYGSHREIEAALRALPITTVMLRPGGIQPAHGERSPHAWMRPLYALGAPLLGLGVRLLPGVVTSTAAVGRAMLVLAAMADAPAVVENDGINRLAAAARD